MFDLYLLVNCGAIVVVYNNAINSAYFTSHVYILVNAILLQYIDCVIWKWGISTWLIVAEIHQHMEQYYDRYQIGRDASFVVTTGHHRNKSHAMTFLIMRLAM